MGDDSPNISIYICLLKNVIFTEHKYLYIHFHTATFGYISIYRAIITLKGICRTTNASLPIGERDSLL